VPGWLGIALFVVAVLIVVMVHESGHFFAARAFGIKVEEFFVGFGPRLWSIRRGETEYGLKALPFGGYVRIAGMNPFKPPTEEERPRTYGAKPIWQRATVILAGPLTHFLMAFVLLWVFFVAIGAPTELRPTIASVSPTLDGRPSPAALAGLRPGDEVVAVDGRPAGSIERFVAYTRAHVGRPIAITVRRGGHELTVRATPVLSRVPGEPRPVGRIGVSVGPGRDRSGPLRAVGRAGVQTWDTTRQVGVHLGQVFGPSAIRRIGELLVGQGKRRATDPTSIIGGARLAGEAVRAGAWDVFFSILVVFNVFVGMVNLAPLPPLDGGHVAVLAYEKLRRRTPDLRKLVPLTAAVAAFIITFAVAVSYLDIVRPLPSPIR
jgi:membrane-associated protease RseP (regulator of RpoE activity)